MVNGVGGKIKYTYDANGNNITATDRTGLTVTMKYVNANPVMYTDPSRYSATLTEQETATTIQSILTGSNGWSSSVIFRAGMNLLSRAWAMKEVRAITYVATDVILAAAFYDVINGHEMEVAFDIAAQILEDVLGDIAILCDKAGIYSDAIYSKIEDALYQAKDKGTDSSKDELPNQGTVEGDVDGAPPVNPDRYLPKN